MRHRSGVIAPPYWLGRLAGRSLGLVAWRGWRVVWHVVRLAFVAGSVTAMWLLFGWGSVITFVLGIMVGGAALSLGVTETYGVRLDD